MLHSLLEQSVVKGFTPGGVVLIADRDCIVHRAAFGKTQLVPAGAGRPVTPSTVYDVASVTKPVVTTALLMRLVADGTIELDCPARRWLPELTGDGSDKIHLHHLASHRSGLPAHIKFYERILAGEHGGAPSPREAILRMAGATPLIAAPGASTLYSDLGFILLGFAIERAAGARLDQLAQQLLFEPLAMTASRFVDLEAGEHLPEAAATEVCPYRGLIVGEVHDQNTHAAGGILGQAGLFSTADDLSRFAAVMAASARGEAGTLLDPAVVARFLTPIPGVTRCLGWDRPDEQPGISHAGDLWPRDGIGHLGYTGTSLWIDPPRGRWVILLANRIHPQVITKELTRTHRAAIMDGAVRLVESGSLRQP